MQQLNVNDFYLLGKRLDEVVREIAKYEKSAPLKKIVWLLFLTRVSVKGILNEPCALLQGSRRAAQGIITVIDSLVHDDVERIFEIEDTQMIVAWQLSNLKSSIIRFETVLSNDMPEMSTFAVAQMGIYRTEALIERTQDHIDESVRSHLEPLALKDITEAGKCLAFRVPTAAAFHMSRAIETGMNQYYEALTGKQYDLKDAAKNWATKTNVLMDVGADERITEFLVHIRKAYRNPITHPDVILEHVEAFNYFSQAVSVISMMLAAVKALEEKNQPLLTGFAALYGTSPAALDSVRPDDDENPLVLKAEVTEADRESLSSKVLAVGRQMF